MRWLIPLVLIILFYGCKDERKLEQFNCNRCAVWESCNVVEKRCDPVSDPCSRISCGDHSSCNLSAGVPECVCDTGYQEVDGLCVVADKCQGTSCDPWSPCNADTGLCELTPGRCNETLDCKDRADGKLYCNLTLHKCVLPPKSEGCNPFADNCLNLDQKAGKCFFTTSGESGYETYCKLQSEVDPVNAKGRGESCYPGITYCKPGLLCNEHYICQQVEQDKNNCPGVGIDVAINADAVQSGFLCACAGWLDCKTDDGLLCVHPEGEELYHGYCAQYLPGQEGGECPEGMVAVSEGYCTPLADELTCENTINAAYTTIHEGVFACVPGDCGVEGCIGYSACSDRYKVCFKEEPPHPELAIGRLDMNEVKLHHFCMIDHRSVSGGVSCWGSNLNAAGMISNQGVGSVKVLDQSLEQVPLEGAVAVVAGDNHSCALVEGESGELVYCWGGNDANQLGTTDLGDSELGVKINFPVGEIDQIVAGNQFTCIKTPAGAVYCQGAMGGDSYSTAGEIDLFPGEITSIEAAWIIAKENILCKVDLNHDLHCFGTDNRLIEDVEKSYIFGNDQQTTALVTFGLEHGCIADKTGVVTCGGSDLQGQQGDSSGVSQVTGELLANRVQLPTSFRIKELSAGCYHTCATDGIAVYCWGRNGEGQSGQEDTTSDARVPALVKQVDPAAGEQILQLITDYDTSCIEVKYSDDVRQWYCWGELMKPGEPDLQYSGVFEAVNLP